MGLILLVDDKRSMVRMLGEAFRAEGYETLFAYNLKESILKLSPDIDAIVVDLKLPDGEGIELVKIAKEHYPFLPVIVITAYATIEKAVSAVKEGAYDFIQKPFDVEQLTHTVKRAIKERELRRENISLKTQFRSFFEEPLLVGQSQVWQNVLRQIDLVA
ncbi:MAG: sigma-54-dependent transcriptional regulator, partial [Desulfatiglandales bacterium]